MIRSIPPSPEQIYAPAAPTETARTTPTTTSNPPTSPVPASVNQKTYCLICKRDCQTVGRYNRHQKEIHIKERFPCRHPPCQKTYSRKVIRDRHESKKHSQTERLQMPEQVLQDEAFQADGTWMVDAGVGPDEREHRRDW